MAPLLSLLEVLQQAQETPLSAEVFAQVTHCEEKLTKAGKPYLDISLADSLGSLSFKVWGDKPWFSEFLSYGKQATLSIQGQWSKGGFGVEAHDLYLRPLSEEEKVQLFSSKELSAKQSEDWQFIVSTLKSLSDPRLRALCLLCLKNLEERLRRAAAARSYHHARRGGLVEHLAGMMKTAVALKPVYPELNFDLLLAGVLFHDIGKLWESCYEENDFSLPYSDMGELLGHIPIGMELLNRLWAHVLALPEASSWTTLSPKTGDVRLHLLHLIASHHGELAFGSPVFPKTPEAMALHYIDNLDAKMEMFRATYQKKEMLSERVFKRNPPLPSSLFEPLAHFHSQEEDSPLS